MSRENSNSILFGSKVKVKLSLKKWSWVWKSEVEFEKVKLTFYFSINIKKNWIKYNLSNLHKEMSEYLNKNTSTLINLLEEKIQQRERDGAYIKKLKGEILSLKEMIRELTEDPQCVSPAVDMDISKAEESKEPESILQQKPPTYHDWITIGTKLIGEHNVAHSTKSQYLSLWEKVAGPIRTNSDIGNLYAQQWFCGKPGGGQEGTTHHGLERLVSF